MGATPPQSLALARRSGSSTAADVRNTAATSGRGSGTGAIEHAMLGPGDVAAGVTLAEQLALLGSLPLDALSLLICREHQQRQ